MVALGPRTGDSARAVGRPIIPDMRLTDDTPTHHRLPLQDVNLSYFEWRPECRGQGPTLLFVHATGFHARVWDQVVRRLPGRHVVALEQRGHGRSQALPFDSWEVFGRDLAAAAQALGLQRAVGIGHSMGGHALVQGAAFAPECFGQLVLIDPVLQSPQRYHQPPVPVHLLPPVAKRKSRFASVDEMVERFADRLPYAVFDRQALRDYCAHALVPADDGDGLQLACAPAFEAQVYAAGRLNLGVYASIRALQVPVLVVRAMLPDPAATQFNPLSSVTWPGIADEFRQGREVFLPEHGHLVPMQDPALVARLIDDALAQGA